jgi:hypothetical protein
VLSLPPHHGTEPDHKPVIPAGKTPGKKKETAPVFTRAEHATLAQKIKILNWYHAHGQKQSATAKHGAPIYPNLRLKQPKISEWARDEAKIRMEFAQSASKSVKRMRLTQHPEITEMLELEECSHYCFLSESRLDRETVGILVSAENNIFLILFFLIPFFFFFFFFF